MSRFERPPDDQAVPGHRDLLIPRTFAAMSDGHGDLIIPPAPGSGRIAAGHQS